MPRFMMMAVWAVGVASWGGSPSDTEALVNGHPITAAEVDAAFARTSVSRQPITEEQRQMYRGHVLNVLIDNTLLKQFLDHKGIQADPKVIENHIAEFKKTLAEKKSNLDAFLADNHANEDQMRKEIADLHQWFAHVEQQASDQNLRDYFAHNKPAFDGSQVRASHILIEFPPTATPKEKEETLARIRKVQMQLASETDFTSLARQHSDCQSKSQGGDVGFFPRKGRMTEPFAQAAFALQVGQVSDIVESEYGYHLIKITDIRPGRNVAYETVADDVKSLFAGDLRGAIITAMRKQADLKITRPTATAQSKDVPATK